MRLCSCIVLYCMYVCVCVCVYIRERFDEGKIEWGMDVMQIKVRLGRIGGD